MTQDTNVENLIINKLTKAQYESITNPDPTQLYFITDEVISSADVINALGFTPYDATNPEGYISSATISSLTDVNLTGLADGQVLKYNSTIQKWENSTVDGGTWGNITGTLSDQTDLQTALDAKQNTISDLSTIRSGASLGATALQPNDNITELVNNAGYITGITSSDVTTALGYTPYNSTNPSGYITSSDLPTVNNGTLTIQKNGTTVGTFTANDTNNVTANISVPTSISNLTDDTSTYPIDKADTLTGLTASVSELNYVDGVTGNIQAQIDNKADTDLSNVSSIDSNSAVQTALDAKVNKAGDTMTGNLVIQSSQGALQVESDIWGSLILKNSNIDKTVTPTTAQYMGIDFRDNNDTRIGFFGVRQGANSTDTRLEFQNVGSTDFIFGHSSSVDGQWIKKETTIFSKKSWAVGTNNQTYSLSSYLPNDGYPYEVFVTGNGNTGATSASSILCGVGSSYINENSMLYRCQTRSSSSVAGGGSTVLPIGTDRNLKVKMDIGTAATGNTYLYLEAYRRIGTNS